VPTLANRSSQNAGAPKRILIRGGGFGGVYTALHLKKLLGHRPDVEIALVAQEKFLLFTPMLHEVAGCDVAVTDVVRPLRKMLRYTRTLIVDIELINLGNKKVRIHHRHLARTLDILRPARDRRACPDDEDSR